MGAHGLWTVGVWTPEQLGARVVAQRAGRHRRQVVGPARSGSLPGLWRRWTAVGVVWLVVLTTGGPDAGAVPPVSPAAGAATVARQ